MIRAASFGEQCRHVTCEEGLECRGHPKICECARSHKSVDDWSKFVDGHRWNLTSFGIFPPVCVARKSKYIFFSIPFPLSCIRVPVAGAVGERCRHDSDCRAVQGSGAVCDLCARTCQCRFKDDAPDVGGKACGPRKSSPTTYFNSSLT